MSAETAVSVVIPAHNAESWIGETLASVRAQTYPRARLDVVVVDDGSSDDTVAVAQRALASSGLETQILRNVSPLGPSSARNRGWRAAKAEWIQFLDADDLIAPDKLAWQMAQGVGAEVDVAIVYSKWGRLVTRAGVWVESETPADPSLGDDPIADLLRAEHFVATGSQLFSRRWLDVVGGFDERHRLIEDVDLHIRLLMAGGKIRSVASERPLFWYRQRPASLSREDRGAFVAACVRNYRMVETFWRQREELSPSRRAGLAENFHTAARYYAEHDGATFADLVCHIETLVPAFVPSAPRALRQLSRVIGYRSAELVAVRYRAVKRRLAAKPRTVSR